MKHILAILTLPALCSFGYAQNAEPSPEELQKQLDALESEISRFKNMLETTEGERTNLETNLEQNEKSINTLIKKIEKIEGDVDNGRKKIGRLRNKQEDLSLAKSKQQILIEKQIQAAHKIGNQEYLKVLLNQEDPNEISRMLTYYDYFNRARAQHITHYTAIIQQLREVAIDIEAENQMLEANREELKVRESELVTVQTAKRRTLIALKQRIRSTGNELRKKQEDRERLEQLLASIRRGFIGLPTPADITPFNRMKGQLLLPVSGAIGQKFGSRRNDGKLRWDGMVIKAEEGTAVQAVHYGRVVFSDWLRGFGLLLIINHGEGYMSLYGHNQVLYRETGDWVVAGETIATVGNSGGQADAGLYFEIRVAGKPADPLLWCKARSKGAA